MTAYSALAAWYDELTRDVPYAAFADYYERLFAERGGETKLLLDLCYEEDSHAQVDLNCVMTGEGNLVELQGTGEGRAFTAREQQELVALCAQGNARLIQLEKNILGEIL